MNKEFYKILSLIFHRPDREFAGYLRNGFVKDIRALDSDAATEFYNFLKENTEKSDEEFYNMLAVEYTRLFIAGVPGAACPPYESIYRENNVMGNSTMDVLDNYSRAGLKVMENFRDLPDHVAVELEFLYYLMDKENTEAYEAFIKEHISRWVPEFCGRVEKNDRTGFYGHAAAVLRKFIEEPKTQEVLE